MAKADKPKVPPAKPHRSAGDTGVPQRGNEPAAGDPADADDAKQANESGEPKDAGRSHGRVIDDDGTPAGGSAAASKDEHWESGRHHAE
jgi:hypothetical protein